MEDRSEVTPPDSELLTVRAVSELIGRPLRSTYRLVHRNRELPVQRIGRRIFVHRQDIDRVLESGQDQRFNEPAIPSGRTIIGEPVDSVTSAPVKTVCSQETRHAEPPALIRERNGQRDLILLRVDVPRVGFLGGFDFLM